MQSPQTWGINRTKLSIEQDHSCLFSQFIQNSLDMSFKVAQMSNIPIKPFHMDGCYVWMSILQDVFISHETYGTAWCKIIKHAHLSKYNYDFNCYRKDIQKHLQLMKAATFPMNGVNSFIMNQLCSSNVARQMETSPYLLFLITGLATRSSTRPMPLSRNSSLLTSGGSRMQHKISKPYWLPNMAASSYAA